MDVKAAMIREDGQWKIRLFLPQWVIDDVRRENDKPQTTLVILHTEYSTPSNWQSQALYYGALLGSCLFEEIMDKKDG